MDNKVNRNSFLLVMVRLPISTIRLHWSKLRTAGVEGTAAEDDLDAVVVADGTVAEPML